MQLDVYIAFFIATTIMILLPGPSVLLTVAHSISFGWRRALLTVAGATCGVGIQVLATFAGMASFMLLLAEGFEWLRWAGVAYLLYLGIKQWRALPEDPGAPQVAARSLFLQGLVVTIPNPKSLLFLAAFFRSSLTRRCPWRRKPPSWCQASSSLPFSSPRSGQFAPVNCAASSKAASASSCATASPAA